MVDGVMYLTDTTASPQAFTAELHLRRTETEAALLDNTRILCPDTPIAWANDAANVAFSTSHDPAQLHDADGRNRTVIVIVGENLQVVG